MSKMYENNLKYVINNKTALIIVDPQNDFALPTGSLYVPNAEEAIEGIKNLRLGRYFDSSAVFTHIVATYVTQDWHPTDHVSFHSNNPGTELFQTIILPDGTEQKMWPTHCVQGSEGAEFIPGIVREGDIIIRKGCNKNVDSYSGFGSEDRVQEITPLLDSLREKKITHVIVVGLAFDYCVSYTAKDAVKNGFKTCVVRAASRGVSTESCLKEEAHMRDAGVKFDDEIFGGISEFISTSYYPCAIHGETQGHYCIPCQREQIAVEMTKIAYTNTETAYDTMRRSGDNWRVYLIQEHIKKTTEALEKVAKILNREI